jgi:hypothetical protein
MNQDLQNKILLALFGVSGPIAKGLALWFGFDGPTVEIILNICMIVTPGIAGWIMAQMSTIANKMAHIQAMNPADQAKIATALADVAVVKEAASRPDVKAVVVSDRTQDPALRQAATDPNQPAILPASQVEVK